MLQELEVLEGFPGLREAGGCLEEVGNPPAKDRNVSCLAKETRIELSDCTIFKEAEEHALCRESWLWHVTLVIHLQEKAKEVHRNILS